MALAALPYRASCNCRTRQPLGAQTDGQRRSRASRVRDARAEQAAGAEGEAPADMHAWLVLSVGAVGCSTRSGRPRHRG